MVLGKVAGGLLLFTSGFLLGRFLRRDPPPPPKDEQYHRQRMSYLQHLMRFMEFVERRGWEAERGLDTLKSYLLDLSTYPYVDTTNAALVELLWMTKEEAGNVEEPLLVFLGHLRENMP